VKAFVDMFPSRIDEYENLLTNNRIWLGRTKGIGFISIEDMLDLGITGPMLRGAGLAIDTRKDAPYSSYEKFDFEVPTRKENDVFARYQVRIEEMRQSTKIIRQAMDGMPGGAWKADAPQQLEVLAVPRRSREQLVGEADAAAVGAQQAREQREQRALAASGGTADSGDTAADLRVRLEMEVAAPIFAIKAQHGLDIRAAVRLDG